MIVTGIRTLSTGFFPEPYSWIAVEKTLNDVGIENSGKFTTTFIFQRCTAFGGTNVVKENWFFGGDCNAELDKEWDFG